MGIEVSAVQAAFLAHKSPQTVRASDPIQAAKGAQGRAGRPAGNVGD